VHLLKPAHERIGLMDDEDRVYVDAQAERVRPGRRYFVLVRADKPLAEEPQASAQDENDVGGGPSVDARQSRPRPKADLRRARLAQSSELIRAAAKRTFGSETPRPERDSEDGLIFSC
jgi:hypothetical protein